MKSRCPCSILGTYEVPESLREVVMIVLTSWKEAHSTYCLTMAQYCPQLGQLFAFARHKMMRREKIFGRSTIAIRNMFSGCRMRGFAREKPYSRFYPSPFTFSPETPINTGVVRGEGLAPPFTTLHPYKHLAIRRLYLIGEGWRVFLKVAFYPPAAWNFHPVFSTPGSKIRIFLHDSTL